MTWCGLPRRIPSLGAEMIRACALGHRSPFPGSAAPHFPCNDEDQLPSGWSSTFFRVHYAGISTLGYMKTLAAYLRLVALVSKANQSHSWMQIADGSRSKPACAERRAMEGRQYNIDNVGSWASRSLKVTKVCRHGRGFPFQDRAFVIGRPSCCCKNNVVSLQFFRTSAILAAVQHGGRWVLS